MRASSRRLRARLVGALLIAGGTALGTATPAVAADEAAISHVEPSSTGLQILVEVPSGTVDLDGVTVTVDGQQAESTAELASATETEEVRRTTVIAIDTSNSMAGARIAAAKAAATQYLAAVPDNVHVGIVTFDSAVTNALAPTQDHAAAQAVVDRLTLRRATRLYDGVLGAVRMAGAEGQRKILVLSDGKDTSKTALGSVTQAIADAEVLVDVVSIDQAGDAMAPLKAMATAGKGQVINSDTSSLQSAFANEASALARQVLVTTQVPSAVTAEQATVAVSLPTGDTTVTAQAFVPVRAAAGDQPAGQGFALDGDALSIPEPVFYGGLAAVGLGLLLLLAMVSSMFMSIDRASIDYRIAQFTEGTGLHGLPSGAGKRKGQKEGDIAGAAKEAAAVMLHRNQTLEARIANRLEAAGSALKPSEWLLLHGLVAMGSALVGLLLAGGLGLVLFFTAGAVVPWVYLGFKRSRRLKAFNASLADTLQLMAGSLSAGLSLSQSVDTIVREGREPITSEFKRVLVETRLGVDLEDALEGVAARMQSRDFSWVVMAIRIQREVGGNLAELLTTVAATLRERDYLRRQVATLSAEGRLSAWILGGLPPAFTVYLVLTRPDYVMPMFTEPVGWMMLASAGVLLSVGVVWMVKVVKIEV